MFVKGEKQIFNVLFVEVQVFTLMQSIDAIIIIVLAIVVITSTATTTVIIIIVIIAPCSSKDGSQGNDQNNGCHDVVDDSGNVAADGNSMEGLGSVPLFSRARVTESKSLEQCYKILLILV